MRTVCRWLLVAFLSVVLTAPLAAQEAPKAKKPEVQPAQPAPNKMFGDWTQVCEAIPAAAPDVKAKNKAAASPTQECFLSQNVLTQLGEGEKAQQGRLLTANVSIVGKDKEKKPALILFLPFGIDVQQEIVVTIENGPQIKGKVDTCLQAGCRVAYMLDDKALDSLKQTKIGQIDFSPVGGKVVGVKLSLAGLAEGIATLK